jgi:hypothetical protein
MVTELIEAQNQLELTRVTESVDALRPDRDRRTGLRRHAGHGGGVAVSGDRGTSRKAAVIVTTNLPFSEWTTKFPNTRLCKAMLDRLTDQAHIIETGDESYRFRRTLAKKGVKA